LNPQSAIRNPQSQILLGDCLDILPTLEAESVDAVVTDPPYGLEFMGKDWDKGVPGVPFWTTMMRVLKPGGHLLNFGGTRTYHRMACAIEDAGFEIRDMIEWIYGSGFPKSLDVSKALDKEAGHWRGRCGEKIRSDQVAKGDEYIRNPKGSPISAEARQCSGWGTALKPAHEPIVVARKPLSEKTVAQNVLKHGTGAVNVDRCRVPTGEETRRPFGYATEHLGQLKNIPKGTMNSGSDRGRWPPNLLLTHAAGCLCVAVNDGTETVEVWDCVEGCPVAEMDQQSGEGASRFFPCFQYCAKASAAERSRGCTQLKRKIAGGMSARSDGSLDGHITFAHNVHPTVKPIDLMRWLVRLVCPERGIVLDPFMGSGTTGIAALRESCRFIGIEREPEYFEIAKARIAREERQGRLF